MNTKNNTEKMINDARKLFVDDEGMNLPLEKKDVLAGPLFYEVKKWDEEEYAAVRKEMEQEFKGFEIIDIAATRATADVMHGLAAIPIQMEDMADITFWLVNVKLSPVKPKIVMLSIYNKHFQELEHLLEVPTELVPFIAAASSLLNAKIKPTDNMEQQ